MGNGTKWTPFIRQLLICSGVWVSHFMYGLCSGSPTVFIPQIRKEANSTTVISDDMASWLTSAIGFSGLPCVIILAIFTRFFGRKISFIIVVVDSLFAFILFYCSNSITQILISEFMQGLFSAAQVTISMMIFTEYSSPKYRGIFLTVNAALYYWGIWVANAIGTFFHWKQIGLLGILCAVYVLATSLFWPESPYWLASKGRFKECAVSHRWLKSSDEDSERELELLINNQKDYLISCRREKLSTLDVIKEWYQVIISKEFYKPLLIASLTGYLIIFSGKLVTVIYAIDIIKKITASESAAYTGMLILDAITVISMYGGCIMSKFLKRRTLLLTSSTIAVFFLLTLSLYLYLIRLSVIAENKYLSVCLLMFYSIAVSCGPLTTSSLIYPELIPLRSRNLATCIISLEAKLLIGSMLKLSPTIFKSLGLHGTFLFFGISSMVIILLLYKYLPETKDKTLQEIADSIQGKSLHTTLEVTNQLVNNNVNRK